MNRLIVAFESEKQRTQIHDVLTTGGVTVLSALSTSAQVVRLVRKMGGGIVITGYKLSGQNAEALASRLEGRAMVLVIAAAPQLEFLEHPSLFKLPAPFTRTELLSSVRMLCQMEEKFRQLTLPQRSAEETALIEQAKEMIMDREGIGEAQAHQALQRRSMNTGRKIADVARELIEAMTQENL